ncbi:hypothetical protein P154DRAFT_562442 [Amniculicola lignicola CBS 123094]|uniref:Ubiquitin-like protease family profile domain-containing protein n=1 Tax=Amniculicola lignicola CBS 123094 TaxID=1392246 RepID=A0A6A5WVT5_9PLEO|nr:hypothetical protein P154DRAFT_562442 [Amniculicola lignicola CBS 123094]
MPSTHLLKNNPELKENHLSSASGQSRTNRVLRYVSRAITVHATRGGVAGLPPTQPTRPSLRDRRYTIDVHNAALARPEDFPVQHLVRALNQPDKSCMEVDLPIQNMNYLKFPHPLRHRELYRVCKGESTFLELETSLLTWEDLVLITDTGQHSWMQDSSLNVALELLGLDFDCKEHGIVFANSFSGQVLWRVGNYGDVDGNDYAYHGDEKSLFRGKDFIFIPINDGYHNEHGDIGGTHWSLLVVNMITKTAHYIDSFLREQSREMEIGFTVTVGLSRIIGEHIGFEVEWFAPQQFEHNLFNGDCGACAPSVYYMSFVLVDQIRRLQDNGFGEGLRMVAQLPEGMGEDFRYWNFNSLHVRRRMQKRILEEKAFQTNTLAQQLTAKHDQEVLQDTGVEALDPPLDNLDCLHEFDNIDDHIDQAGESGEIIETEATKQTGVDEVENYADIFMEILEEEDKEKYHVGFQDDGFEDNVDVKDIIVGEDER